LIGAILKRFGGNRPPEINDLPDALGKTTIEQA
jgi:hypothetical protein